MEDDKDSKKRVGLDYGRALVAAEGIPDRRSNEGMEIKSLQERRRTENQRIENIPVDPPLQKNFFFSHEGILTPV